MAHSRRYHHTTLAQRRLANEALTIAKHILVCEKRGKPFALPGWKNIEPEMLEWLSLLAHELIKLSERCEKTDKQVTRLYAMLDTIHGCFQEES